METAQRGRVPHDGGIEAVEAMQSLHNFFPDRENPLWPLQRGGVERVDQTSLPDDLGCGLWESGFEHVVEYAHRMHQVANVIAVTNHIGRRFGGYHAVELVKIEIVESQIGLPDLIEIALVAVDLDDFRRRSRIKQRITQPDKEALGAALFTARGAARKDAN